LQTSEYARAVLTTVQQVWSDARPSIGEAVTARVHRQEILEDSSKRFHFVMPETLLRNLIARAEDMPAQIARIMEIASQDNVSIAFIPEQMRWSFPPYHGFELLDDKHVIIDLFNTVVVSPGSTDIRSYRQVFDALAAQASYDIEPILEKYRRMYLRLAQES
jgi:hypothetical protein